MTAATVAYTDEVAARMKPLYERVKNVIPEIEWPTLAPYIDEINRLKKEKNAVILAHNYMTPDIVHGVADIQGDSLALAIEASKVDADIIVMAGVKFMAETAKILNMGRTVLIPDMRAGCSLAASITAQDVRDLRAKYPGVPTVAYVNTSVEVKAEVDICCTSSNAVSIVESLGVDRVIFLPDQYLAKWVASQTNVEIIPWAGSCEVHERFTGKELRQYREGMPGLHIVAHPECPPDVLSEADFVGSTSGMVDHLRRHPQAKAMLITECSMSDNVAVQLPATEFIRPCNLCPHMKRITLAKILDSLQNLNEEIVIDPELAARARTSVERMVQLNRRD